MKSFLQRRAVLGLIASSVLAACKPSSTKPSGNASTDASVKQAESSLTNHWRAAKQLTSSMFQYGIASGDPAADSVVIWTHVNANAPALVDWEVSLSPDFKELVSHGQVTTDAEQDFTVKAIPANLKSGTAYYYRFKFANTLSPVGRTKTLPVGSLNQYGIALASCSNYAFGFFNAYDAIANDSKVDLVLHTGDYIYEYGADGWGAETAQQIGRVHEPAHEIVSLADYRARHAQYKTDQGSLAMHATHPMVCCWDDHETANNPWIGGAQNHQADTEGEWADRRSASVRAYYEWMPIRDPHTLDERLAFSRAYRIGDLANLVTLETRHTARAEQIDYLKYFEGIQSMADAERFTQDVIAEPGRRMLSSETEALVQQEFAPTEGTMQPWHLLGSASPIARMLVPDVLSMGVLDGEPPEQMESFAAQALVWKGKYNMPFYTDTWDGYPWARQRFYEACQSVSATDLVFLTGDSHSFWINKISDDSGVAMGVELGTAGISSPGDFVESGWSRPVAEKLDRLFESQLDEVIWTDNLNQGYVRLDLGREQAEASFVAVSTVLEPNYTSRVIKRSVIQRNDNALQFAT
ncbi:alkaline phosphatase D family protein [Arenicella xantha]|uniref:Alkaline phosphatase/alkaline phosphatase D n=1 Tax=Arenicella xantha TaxID=644221 RepID=A0A395JKV9_9GAMM|nr:alkaline phosphatase D family protein [Arenicella xantha]RBP51341.1 alkaline phosphatase/alkaline phosphatase D [Arenicella xantha]